MKKINKKWTIGEILNIPELEPVRPYLLFCGENNQIPDWAVNTTVEDAGKNGWSVEGIIKGVEFAIDQFSKNASIHFVYPEEECREEPLKRDVNIIRFTPEVIDRDKPYVVLVSGGGYTCVCTMVESLPTAAHFVKQGYQVFSVTYRVNQPEILPKAQEDLAACFRYIKKHSEEFQLNPDVYAIGGFSAGANLISSWGTASLGYKKYNMAKPKAMFPVYAPIDISFMFQNDAHEENMQLLYGDNRSSENLHKYNVIEHIDENYPPCYIVCGKNDMLVSCSNSEKLKELLDALHIAAELEEPECAQHGFGDGSGTAVDGWPERAIRFMESQLEK